MNSNDSMTAEQLRDVQKQVAVTNSIVATVETLAALWPDGLRVDVAQAGIGAALTDSFLSIEDIDERRELLDSFCDILRSTVLEAGDDDGEEQPAPGHGYPYEEPYKDFVARMFAKKSEGEDGFMHAGAGLSGEAGEVLDHIKKHWVYGKKLDRALVMEELGDMMFYAVAICNQLGCTLSDVIGGNVAKLTKRYPDGYSDAAAINRADKAEAA